MLQTVNMTETEAVLARLSSNLRDRRRAMGLTQREVARRAGLDRSYVSQVEQGSRDVGVSTLVRLAEALETTVGELLGG